MFESVNQTTNWDNGNLPLPPSPHVFPGAAEAHKRMAPVVEGMADAATTMHPQAVPSSTAAASAAKAVADQMPGSAAAADNASTNPSEVSEGSSMGEGRVPQHSNEAHSTAAVTSATAQPDSATIVSSHLQTADSAGSGRRPPHYDGGDMAVAAGALQPQGFSRRPVREAITSSTAGQVSSALNRRLGSQGSATSDITPIAPASLSLGVQELQMESPPTSSEVDLTRISGSNPHGIRRMQQ
jgi:hypothetical protein